MLQSSGRFLKSCWWICLCLNLWLVCGGSIDTDEGPEKKEQLQHELSRLQVLWSDPNHTTSFIYDVAYQPHNNSTRNSSQQQLAAASLGRIYLWNSHPTNKSNNSGWQLEGVVDWPQPPRAVRQVRYSTNPDDTANYVAAAGDDGTVRIYSSATTPWTELVVLDLTLVLGNNKRSANNSTTNNDDNDLPQPRSLAWNPTQPVLAVAGAGFPTTLFDTRSWKPLTLPFETVALMAVMLEEDDDDNTQSVYHSLDWNPSGTQLIVDNTIYNLDLTSKTSLLTPDDAWREHPLFATGISSSSTSFPRTPTSSSFTLPRWKPDGTAIAAASMGMVAIATVVEDTAVTPPDAILLSTGQNKNNNNTTTTTTITTTTTNTSLFLLIQTVEWDAAGRYLLVGGAGPAQADLWYDWNKPPLAVPTSQNRGVTAVSWQPVTTMTTTTNNAFMPLQFAVAHGGAIDIWELIPVENIIGTTPNNDNSTTANGIDTNAGNGDSLPDTTSSSSSMHWAIPVAAVLLVLCSVAAVGVALRWRWNKVASPSTRRHADSNKSLSDSELGSAPPVNEIRIRSVTKKVVVMESTDRSSTVMECDDTDSMTTTEQEKCIRPRSAASASIQWPASDGRSMTTTVNYDKEFAAIPFGCDTIIEQHDQSTLFCSRISSANSEGSCSDAMLQEEENHASVGDQKAKPPSYQNDH